MHSSKWEVWVAGCSSDSTFRVCWRGICSRENSGDPWGNPLLGKVTDFLFSILHCLPMWSSQGQTPRCKCATCPPSEETLTNFASCQAHRKRGRMLHSISCAWFILGTVWSEPTLVAPCQEDSRPNVHVGTISCGLLWTLATAESCIRKPPCGTSRMVSYQFSLSSWEGSVPLTHHHIRVQTALCPAVPLCQIFCTNSVFLSSGVAPLLQGGQALALSDSQGILPRLCSKCPNFWLYDLSSPLSPPTLGSSIPAQIPSQGATGNHTLLCSLIFLPHYRSELLK